MTEIDQVNPPGPLWPPRPVQRPGPKKRSPGRKRRPATRPVDEERRDGNDRHPKHIDEYV